MRVVEVLEQFLTAKKGQKRKLRSIDFYEQVITRFIAWMEAENLGDQVGAVRPDVIDRFMASEADRLAAATLHGRYRALNALFNWAEGRRELKKHLYRRLSPMREVEPPTVPRREQKAISYADWQRLLKAINFESWIGARDYLLVMTLFLSGIRASELIRLQVEDFDFENRVLVIREGKRGDYECVPLLEPVARAFVAFLFVRPAWPTTEVFLAADGSAEPKPDGVLTRSGVWQLLERLRKKAGVGRANPHAFRHGLARFLLNDKGADMAIIQQILRHKRITPTAEVYAIYKIRGVAHKYTQLMGTAAEDAALFFRE